MPVFAYSSYIYVQSDNRERTIEQMRIPTMAACWCWDLNLDPSESKALTTEPPLGFLILFLNNYFKVDSKSKIVQWVLVQV